MSSAPDLALRAQLLTRPLSIEQVSALVAHPGAGAIDLFVGVVRDHAEGRAVSSLEYSAYESMAQKEIARIIDEVEQKVPGARCAVHHRIGLLAVGELAIVCAASTPHRAESFAACRALIEEVKHRVPIWKRERGPDGEAWVGWVDARCGLVGHGHGDDHEGGRAHEHDHGHA
ncbi:MAG: molybdenum cofactor biosynthesis protein MoaE, partial [Sandaracinaceae bacterium]|nr:molybdenum cofactor biosynthesis protein MoaE [Sandaracinaceae bacterium]